MKAAELSIIESFCHQSPPPWFCWLAACPQTWIVSFTKQLKEAEEVTGELIILHHLFSCRKARWKQVTTVCQGTPHSPWRKSPEFMLRKREGERKFITTNLSEAPMTCAWQIVIWLLKKKITKLNFWFINMAAWAWQHFTNNPQPIFLFDFTGHGGCVT